MEFILRTQFSLSLWGFTFPGCKTLNSQETADVKGHRDKGKWGNIVNIQKHQVTSGLTILELPYRMCFFPCMSHSAPPKKTPKRLEQRSLI